MPKTNTKTSSSSKKPKTSDKKMKEEKPEEVVVATTSAPAKKVSSKKKAETVVASEAPAKKSSASKKKVVSSEPATEKKMAPKKAKKPKTARPPTAYNLFMREKIQTITGSDQKEKLKAVATMWREMAPKGKESYNKEAATLKEAFVKKQLEDPEYNAKKANKRTPNGYNLFIQARMPDVSGSDQISKLRAIAKEWSALDKTKKGVYQKEASKRKDEAKKMQEAATAQSSTA